MPVPGARTDLCPKVTFGVRLRGAFVVAEVVRLADVFLDPGEAPAVRLLGLRIEERAGVRTRRPGEAAALASRDLPPFTGPDPGEARVAGA